MAELPVVMRRLSSASAPTAPHRVGAPILLLLEETGRLVTLLSRTLHWLGRGAFEPAQTFAQMVRVGVESLPIILVTGAFSGMVLAFQTSRQLIQFGAQSFVGGLVTVSLAREAAPVFTAVTVAGRIGAGFAAELGAMAVTEQIEALRAMGTDPVRYLVLPRVLAGMCMLPLLTVFANLAGAAGGFTVATVQGVEPAIFLASVQRFLTPFDYLSGLIKAASFGVIIALIGSYRGVMASGGAEGVGRATTAAVVSAIVIILIWNYFLDLILF